MEPRSFARTTCAREDLRPSIRDNCLLITAITLAMIGDRTGVVKGYSMPAIGHRNVTVPPRVSAGVE
ncbi:hypothetical protein PMI06_005449 [Burkholderia sp. BT03]|nr:hypothetical protein PMI06_005449 [Burkholderia sp. BT03]SKC81333.1 hypothetical protein SAMN06266956_3734 [Paraburkholderia hospita]